MDSIQKILKSLIRKQARILKTNWFPRSISRARFLPSAELLGHRRECRVCGECKTLDQFPVGRSDCKSCLSDSVSKYRRQLRKSSKVSSSRRKCKTCHKVKSLSEFPPFRHECKSCRQAWVANYRRQKKQQQQQIYSMPPLPLPSSSSSMVVEEPRSSPLSPISSSSLSSSSTDNDIASSLRLTSDSVAHPVLDHADAAAVATITTNTVGVPKKMATKIDVSVFGKRNLRTTVWLLFDWYIGT